MLRALTACAVVLTASAGRADEGNKRLVYQVRYGTAKDLADALNKHFKGDAAVDFVAEPASNCLLLSAKPAVLAEAVKALEVLDRRPRPIAAEIIVVELPGDKGPDEKDLSGPVGDVLARLEALQKKGQVGAITRLQVTGVENQPSRALQGENKPIVSGITQRPTGIVSRSIRYHNVGTNVKMTPSVNQDGSIALDLDVQTARLHAAPDAPEIGKDEKGEPVRMLEAVTATVAAKVSVRPGQAVPVQGVKTVSKAGQTQTLVIVTARALDEGKPDK
jgi:type II secretory pathway component GspD/PulD (secretin)